VRGFIERYVRGWADNGCAYLTIPLERDAYVLAGAHDSNPTRRFPSKTKSDGAYSKAAKTLHKETQA
jgi:hypothetical protein